MLQTPKGALKETKVILKNNSLKAPLGVWSKTRLKRTFYK